MREIKFRAWSKEFKRWWPVGTIDFVNKECAVTTDYGSWLSLPIDTMVQYTGLSDKNGVKIYDGDILRLENGEIQQIKWDINMFTVPRISWVHEVIGNIHEGQK